MKPEFEIFQRFLKSQGLSFTKQRNRVLESVYRNHNHFDAEELASELRDDPARISRATVYRTLGQLEKSGLIRRLDLGHGHAHYEHVLGHEHHEHLVCAGCGRVVEFARPALESEIQRIAEEQGFVQTSHYLQIRGFCRRCKPDQGGAHAAG